MEKGPSRGNNMSKWLKERGSIARGRNYKIFSRQGHREQGSSDRRSRKAFRGQIERIS